MSSDEGGDTGSNISLVGLYVFLDPSRQMANLYGSVSNAHAVVQTRRFPETRNDLQKFPRNLNLTGWRHGLYTLKKEPMGLIAQRLEQSRLVGIDPGKRSFITASPPEEPFNMNPELRRDTIVEVPSRHYQHQVMQNWFNNK
ncbi:hypothetical protein BJV82DRAFT_708109 [Fennellomyces sp. T-0311]|nr:hypothetical protein BJV82DRAFT_708109 [Fennellomyces sp. T-0311]